MSTKVLFGGAIALILLGLYAFLVLYALSVVLGWSEDGFKPGMVSGLATIGGLVSALVIAELSVTKPGESPAARVLDPGTSDSTKANLKVVTFLYLAVWLALGVAAFVVGGLLHEGALPALTDLGQTWLGIAVAAGYAYLGIDPSRNGG